MYDSSGEEKYHSLVKSFYKDKNVIIMVYDITNRNSFKKIQDYWLNEC